jgi:hypothetical protein
MPYFYSVQTREVSYQLEKLEAEISRSLNNCHGPTAPTCSADENATESDRQVKHQDGFG